jgi:hypothetical protein
MHICAVSSGSPVLVSAAVVSLGSVVIGFVVLGSLGSVVVGSLLADVVIESLLVCVVAVVGPLVLSSDVDPSVLAAPSGPR